MALTTETTGHTEKTEMPLPFLRGLRGSALLWRAAGSRLPTRSSPSRTTRSLDDPDGLIATSKRGERLLFWPMGIASAGAMRQWGGHATAFVGRRHFDDADLIEKRFALSGE